MEPKRPKLTPEEKYVQKECQDAEIAALKQKLVDVEAKLMSVTAELEQVKNERAYDKINFETEKCGLESKIGKYEEQCSELQRENEKFQTEKAKLQSENEKLRRYLQDLESSNIQSPMNLSNTNLNSQTTKVMDERHPETPGVNHPPGIPRDYLPRSMPISNPLCHSGVGLASNMSTSRYPSTASTAGNLSSSSYPASSSSYLPVPPYPVSTSTYCASSNSTYPRCVSPYPPSSNSTYPRCVSPYPPSSNSQYPASTSSYLHASSNKPYPESSSSYLHANSNKPYPASSSSYLHASSNMPYPASSSSYRHASSNKPYPASSLPYADSSNRHYAASCISPYSTPTSLYSDRHHPAPPSIKQSPSSFPCPSMGSRGYTSKFGPNVNEANYDAWNFNDFPNEVIEKIFSFLTQNQLGQIARVCRRWNVLKKSPALWRKVNVEIFCSSDGEGEEESKSLIDGLPSCVTFIKFHFVKRGYLDLDFSERVCYLNFGELCTKLHHKCPQVKVLILAWCGISTNLPEAINVCTQFLHGLKKLVLHHCDFKDHSVTKQLNSNIEVLDLNCSFVSYSKKIKFSKLHSLTELRLAETNIGDTWFVCDESLLNQLQVLDLRWTNVTASTFTAIQRHGQNLRDLYLCGLYLRDHDLNFNVPVFPQLQTICLSDTDVTCEGLVSLVRCCPSLVSVYVREDVARSFEEHPFVVANRCRSGIVKTIHDDHNHNVDYSPN